ncbi:MAG: di-trans,poly-cis-decaprenylcistransferase [Treponema sp.]|uniref:polyprenyl diphosphate synthase n=1 Tax=Treponema sp. TaxID=166 RepID=UPI001D660C33|nr:polyprenyl diphosphate synthase [Treponema sp.]MBS7311450.1 di-trans,poly-cis-decaprenylcistransferase [Treponema sp.]MCI5696860.1 polyprenyl diphosphate synthase [Spirochaetia bacterium]MDD5811638.1 polyprenyl diphosphate synthase [Treponema sp.]
MSQSAQASDNKQPPLHIGIIMDGNGRWAQKRGLARTAGHKEGLETAKKIVKACANAGIKYVTLYTFSTENWKRAQEEVGYLMGLIKGHLRSEFEFYKANGIRIEHLGDLKGLPEDVQTEIINAKEETKNFTGLTVVLAINYGGRDEIIRSVKKIIEKQFDSDSLTEKSISDNFDIPELPDVDFLIRTGGEKRLSNFLLWHSAYAELCFTDTLWPDYTEDELIENLNEFYKRTRRFGDVLIK